MVAEYRGDMGQDARPILVDHDDGTIFSGKVDIHLVDADDADLARIP